MHFFQRLCTTTETCCIESINLGYNARFFATLTKIDKYIKYLISKQKSDGRFTLRGKFTSIRVIHICHFLKHVKLLGLAEQNHGYLTSLHRIRSDKISDKERRGRKFPILKWPPCCDVTWLSNLIMILDCQKDERGSHLLRP